MKSLQQGIGIVSRFKNSKRKKPKYNEQSIIGHHTYNAMNYPHISNRGELIYPVTSREHLRGWHGGSYSKNAPGKAVNPNYIEEF